MKSEKVKSTEKYKKFCEQNTRSTQNDREKGTRPIHAKHTMNALSNDMQMQDGIVECFRNCDKGDKI